MPEDLDVSFCPSEPAPDEEPADVDSEFLARCQADVVSMAGGPVNWKDQLWTRSPKWGLVWRADYLNPGRGEQSYPSRVTCWKRDNGEFGMTVGASWGSKLELKR